MALSNDGTNFRLQRTAGDVHLPGLVDVDVHFTPHAKLRQVDPRLDGEAGPGHDATVVARFEAVDVGAVAVHFLADVVAGTVREFVAVTGLVDHRSRGVIDFGARERSFRGERLADAVDTGVASGSDDVKNLLVLRRHLAADESDASQVAVN